MPRSTATDHVEKGMKAGILHRIKLRQLGAKGKKVFTYFYGQGPAPSCRKPKQKV